ncbi:MAG: DUF2281 domain-containing protein [Anaerolineales bacterium]|nr:DUF2281 domain-containing protein [Anaerolineales bacterium]
MTLLEQLQNQILKLPPERQSEVLDFVNFLQEKLSSQETVKRLPLRTHPAFGSWKKRGINALNYQQSLRAEWDHRA